MDMYFVDRNKIEEKLQFLDKHLQIFDQMESLEDDIFKLLSVERAAHIIIDCIIDVGNAMIDGFIMRDPGSYEDIIDILLDEKVITEEMAKDIIELIKFRKKLVQEYTEVDHQSLFKTVKTIFNSLSLFSGKVRDYFINELGPVSAFKN
jgi:uncharacterized protein YutE (UPF0331/DUF86 family)